jgi:hypothetical protein
MAGFGAELAEVVTAAGAGVGAALAAGFISTDEADEVCCCLPQVARKIAHMTTRGKAVFWRTFMLNQL